MIDDGEGAEWADFLRWHPFPFIADERDGTTFRNIAFRSNATVNDAPAVTDQRPLDAGERSGDAAPFSPDVRTPHDTGDTDA